MLNIREVSCEPKFRRNVAAAFVTYLLRGGQARASVCFWRESIVTLMQHICSCL